jgi:hypothetical protein
MKESKEHLKRLEMERDEFLLAQAMVEAEEFVTLEEFFSQYEAKTGHRLDGFDDRSGLP